MKGILVTARKLLFIFRGRKRMINCNVTPLIPDGWDIVEHKKNGYVVWNPTNIALYVPDSQKNGLILGNDLYQELRGKFVANACMLDYLLKHKELIPLEWKGEIISFWGTVYRDSNGKLRVRDLRWTAAGWDWRDRWLDCGWSDIRPAALHIAN